MGTGQPPPRRSHNGDFHSTLSIGNLISLALGVHVDRHAREDYTGAAGQRQAVGASREEAPRPDDTALAHIQGSVPAAHPQYTPVHVSARPAADRVPIEEEPCARPPSPRLCHEPWDRICNSEALRCKHAACAAWS
jgi:hypothetical protein